LMFHWREAGSGLTLEFTYRKALKKLRANTQLTLQRTWLAFAVYR